MSDGPDEADLQLPSGAVLVHIGPYKTGTTALQNSLAAHRAQLLEHGVLYPGDEYRQRRPGWAVLGRSPMGAPHVPIEVWQELVAQIRDTDGVRAVISTEDLASAGPKVAKRVVADLGPERVHLVIGIRRLDKLLPSGWQQRVKTSYETRTYDEWLHDALDVPRENQGQTTFWINQGVDQLLGRWRDLLPPEQLILLVQEEGNLGRQPRTFEALLGLPEGLLAPTPYDNASLTAERVEFYRQVNLAFDRNGWSDKAKRDLVHRGMLHGLQQAPGDDAETAIPKLPRWAAERVFDLSESRAREVADSGCRVIGDPEWLRFGLGEHDAEFGTGPATMPIAAAAAAVETLVQASMQDRRRRAKSRQRRRRADDVPRLDDMSSRALLREVLGRQRRRLRRG